MTKLQCATAHVAHWNFVTETNETNMASSDSNDDIFASSLVLVSLLQIKSVSWAQKREKNVTTVSQFVPSVCEEGS